MAAFVAICPFYFMFTPDHVNRLELHVTHRCNLTCESCSHYMNHVHQGDILPGTADQWMAAWSGRMTPPLFRLLGGEPTLNPDLVEILYLARSHWPATRLQITTNGFFLCRHPDLPKAMAETGCTLCLSIHHTGREYMEKMGAIQAVLQKWQSQYSFKIMYNKSAQRWTRRYTGYGPAMQPFDDRNPRASWEICPAKHCRQLHEGLIWKCAPLAYLPMQAGKFSLGPEWKAYLGYQALDPSCSDKELRAFFELEDESYCGMCPGHARPFDKPNPMQRVSTD